MPGLNGTGPAGAGKMTGWRLGLCGNNDSFAFGGIYGRGMGFGRGMGMHRGLGLGRGCGLGYGRGYGPGFRAWTTPVPEMEAEDLKGALQCQKDFLKARLEAIDKRLETL